LVRRLRVSVSFGLGATEATLVITVQKVCDTLHQRNGLLALYPYAVQGSEQTNKLALMPGESRLAPQRTRFLGWDCD
jgi:hypothetical protein